VLSCIGSRWQQRERRISKQFIGNESNLFINEVKMKYLLAAMRPHQWLKNFFIFLPLIFGQKLLDIGLCLRILYVFVGFSLVASAIYLLNDIMDIEQDKLNPEKRNRPIASGKVTISKAAITALVLITAGLIGAFTLNKNCAYVIIIYIILNFLYMKFLKKVMIIDIFCVGAFFYIRILIGGLISGVELSNWIIICGVLLALFLALNKRRHDLGVFDKQGIAFSRYNPQLIDRMISIISSSVVMAYILYATDARTIERFGTNRLIYTVPFVFYGVLRYLYIVDTKRLGGDPARILIGDGKMQLNLALWLVASISVIYFKI